jgi:hypothetical protein
MLAHDVLRPRNYVEIGCRFGSSLALSRSPAIGIDPDFQITEPLGAPTRLYRMTSDEFFRAHDVRQLLDGEIDFAFIDGMHNAEFALWDFINLERAAAPGSVISIDDVLPGDILHASRERRTQAWTGDVYKLALILRKFRPDLSVEVFNVALKGFCLVSHLDPGSCLLSDNYDLLEAQIAQDVYTFRDIPSLRRALAPAPAESFAASLAKLAGWRGHIAEVEFRQIGAAACQADEALALLPA